MNAPKSPTKSKFIGYAYLVLSVLAWGVSIPLNKLLLKDGQPLTTLAFQLIGSVLFISIIILVRKIKIDIKPKVAILIATTGLLEPALAYYLGFVGIQHTSSMHASVIYALEPVGIVIFNALLFRHKTTPTAVVAIAISVGGIALISLDTGETSGVDLLRGDLIIFLGVMAASLYVALSNRFTNRNDVVHVIWVQQLTSVICIAVIYFAAHSLSSAPIPMIDFAFTASAFAVGSLQFGVAFIFYFKGLQIITNSSGLLILNTTPIIGIAASGIILGEQLSIQYALGASIIIICMAYVAMMEHK